MSVGMQSLRMIAVNISCDFFKKFYIFYAFQFLTFAYCNMCYCFFEDIINYESDFDYDVDSFVLDFTVCFFFQHSTQGCC